jgi:hypothetical protein
MTTAFFPLLAAETGAGKEKQVAGLIAARTATGRARKRRRPY